jgi:hypothetical protein
MARRVAGSGSGPWCSICGRSVTDVTPTLDPRYPTGVCSYQGSDGYPAGHGRVPAVRDSLRLADLLRDRRERGPSARHGQHSRGNALITCWRCRSAGWVTQAVRK